MHVILYTLPTVYQNRLEAHMKTTCKWINTLSHSGIYSFNYC